ncbi:MAG: hypothetical protein ACRDVP_12225 [Acidimicrobiales bacterium]
MLLVVPVVAVGLFRLSSGVQYAATADLQAQTSTPDADTQVFGILSRVTAVATSPGIVEQAIRQAGVSRNPVDVAKHEVSTTSLNSSAVVQLTVADPDRGVAIRLTRALAGVVAANLNTLSVQGTQELATLAKERAQLVTTRNTLLKELAAGIQDTTSVLAQTQIAELNAVETQLSNNLSAQQQALANSPEGAAVISRPFTAVATSRHVVVDCVLAGILGLVLGLLIATIRESLRPTVADPAAAARDLGVVLLGGAVLTGASHGTFGADLVTRLQLSAARQGISTIVLTGALSRPELAALGTQLDQRLVKATPKGRNRRGWPPPGFQDVAGASRQANGANGTGPARTDLRDGLSNDGELRVGALPELIPGERPQGPALVVVMSEFAPRRALEEAADLSSASGWPILGVMGIELARGPKTQPRTTGDPRALTSRLRRTEREQDQRAFAGSSQQKELAKARARSTESAS